MECFTEFGSVEQTGVTENGGSMHTVDLNISASGFSTRRVFNYKVLFRIQQVLMGDLWSAVIYVCVLQGE
jgi:hypothetical protein